MWTIVPFIVNCRTWTILKGVSAHELSDEKVVQATVFLFREADFVFSDLSRIREAVFVYQRANVSIPAPQHPIR